MRDCEFGRKLKIELINNNMSQTELAEKVNVSRGTINCICSGSRKPSIELLTRISKELNVSTDYLLGLN